MLSAMTHDVIGHLDAAISARDAGRRLVASLAAFGVRGVFAGSFPGMPSAQLDERTAQREVLAQISPHGWQDSYARRDLDKGNPVIMALGRTTKPFLWSEGGVPGLQGWKGLDLARELGIEDGLAVPCPELAGRVGVISLAFEKFSLSPGEVRIVQFAAIVAYERMRTLAPLQTQKTMFRLTARERDCLAFVAEGKSASDIGDALGVSANTVNWHVKNAKRKLGVRTRAQAVARFYAARLI